MSEIPRPTPLTAPPPQTLRTREDEPTGWTGWVLFAAIMLIMMGAFQAVMGFVALFDDSYYLVPGTGLVVHADYTTWGWIHLLLGVVAIIAGVGIVVGQTWARVIGVILAAISALVNMAFLAAYPIWSVLIITFDIIAIYALVVHGRELRE
jgi:hypothetical protein